MKKIKELTKEELLSLIFNHWATTRHDQAVACVVCAVKAFSTDEAWGYICDKCVKEME